jgi:DNA-binding NtrC family response regulator
MATILVIEDEQPIAHAYQLVLEQAGYRVIIATNANDAMKLIQDEKPAVVLLDILMPDINGLELLKKLDLKSNFPDTKVFAISNVETPSVAEEALKLGAADYLRKVDYTPRQIVELVQKTLGE